MEHFKRLEDLTLMDDYMFGAVMQDPKLIRPLIEFILNVRIRSIRYIEPQKAMKSGFESKGIRLDLYVEDESGAVYNVEVQTTRHTHLAKRMRYYQSAIDTHVLSPGADYAQLRKSYIIFICNHDPYGRSRCIYRFENRCIEEPELAFGDETVKVIVNTRGTVGETSEALKEVLRYLNDGTVSGDYSRELAQAVTGIKASEERRHEYMIMMVREQELIDQGRREGEALGRREGEALGRREGEALGRDRTLMDSIRSLMAGLNLTAQQAMDLLNIPTEEQSKYAERL